MHTIVRGKVSIVLGAINRAQQIDLWQQLDTLPEGISPVAQSELLADYIAAAAVHRIQVTNGKDKQSVGDEPVTIDLDGISYEVSVPLPVERFRQLPVTLTNEWLAEALRLNDGVAGAYFLASNSLTDGANSSS